MSPAGYLGPRPQGPDQSDEDYACHLEWYRERLLADNPWLEDERHASYTRFVLRRLWGDPEFLVGAFLVFTVLLITARLVWW